MKKNLITAAAVLVMAVGVPMAPGHGQESDKAFKALMMRKLTNSEKILEGLTLNDFDKVSKHAEDLIDIGKAAQFRALKTPDYELYSNQFRRNCQALIKQAKAKNTDGVALAYVDMTLTCVKCHQHVREVRMAMLDLGTIELATATDDSKCGKQQYGQNKGSLHLIVLEKARTNVTRRRRPRH